MGAKGTPKTGGRKRGSPNKKTLAVQEMCEAKGISPLEVLIDLLTEEDKNLRSKVAMELMPYIYARRTSIDISAEVDLNLAKQVKEYAELPKEEQIKLMEAEIKRLKAE